MGENNFSQKFGNIIFPKMIDNEDAILQKNVDEFTLENKEKIEVISNLQEQLINIDEISFSKIIDYIKNHKNIFFNDHKSAIFFFKYLIFFSRHNFKKLEQILDIIIYFSDDLKNERTHVKQSELFEICNIFYLVSINYLYFKNFFTIEDIIKKSFKSCYIFINFLPEIEKYDHEYAELMLKNKINENIKESFKSFISLIQSDYQKHILNRNSCYNQSSLHKSIRDDDINLFQKLISQNNIKLDDKIEFSFYERAKTIDENICPLKVAALYGSVHIFKFLLMNNATIDDDLLKYAYSGCNAEIIHLIENKCSFDECYFQPILNFHNELLDYFIDNFGFEIVENDTNVKKILSNFHDDNCQYDILAYNGIRAAVITGNYPIIRSCIKKTAFFIRNVDLVEISENEADNKSFILQCCAFDIDLLNFFINQMKQDLQIIKLGSLFSCIRLFIELNANDAFKLLFFKLRDYLNIMAIFDLCIEDNIDMARYLLDIQMEEFENNKDDSNSLYHKLKDKIDFSIIEKVFNNYDEDVIVNIIKLYDPIKTIDELSSFTKLTGKSLTVKMILSLFEKLCKILRRDKLVYIAASFEDNENYSISEFIKKKLPKKAE